MCAAALGMSAACVFAQPRGAFRDRIQPLTSEQTDARWGEFLKFNIATTYRLKFSLTHSPRKGDDVEYEGEAYGKPLSPGGFKMRISLWRKTERGKVYDYILQSTQKESAVWKAGANGKFAELPESQWSEPLAPEIIFSAFDFVTPFKSWNAKYTRAGRIGQIVYFFELAAPQKFADKIGRVEVALSGDFNVAVETRTFAPNGARQKTFSLKSVGKIDGFWVMKEAQIRDEATRNKDTIRFFDGKFGIPIASDIFEPSAAVSRETPDNAASAE